MKVTANQCELASSTAALTHKVRDIMNRNVRKSQWVLGVSPLALAACGGGGDTEVGVAVVTGTTGADTFPNTSANERFEGGLGNDVYNVSLSGSDTVVDTGGNDTIKVVWRDEANVRQVEEVYAQGDDLVFDMTGASNVIVLEGAFADETRIENVQYYHAAGNWGDDYVAKIFKFGEEISADGSTDNLIVGTNDGEALTFLQGDIDGAGVYAAGGNDTITTGDGTQYLYGGNGDDILDGGDGNDFVYGGDGNDTVYMSPGADIEDGGDGVDTLILSDWAGSYSGTLNLETGANFAAGGADNSNHKIYNFENITTQNVGNMTIIGTSGDNIIVTGSGDDVITGGAGNDLIYPGDGNDIVNAGPGDDVIVASPGADFENGGDGNDTLMAASGAGFSEITYNLSNGTQGLTGGDLTVGFTNIENIKLGYLYTTGEHVGTTTNYTIIGSDENNIIETSNGDDELYGGEGNDELIGGTGDDTLQGGSGNDFLTGGEGADTFIFKLGETGADTIRDFNLSEGDKLDLSSYGISTEAAAQSAMSDLSGSVELSIDGNLVVSFTSLSFAEFAAADGWIA